MMPEPNIDGVAAMHQHILVLLTREWLPLGWGDPPTIEEDYCYYASNVYDIITTTHSPCALAHYLSEIERDRMVFTHPRSEEKLHSVAWSIFNSFFA